MVSRSLNGAYSEGGSRVLWEDGERVVHRAWRLEPDGNQRTVLIVVPAAQHPSRSSLDHLAHEYDLKDQLDSSWAVPLDLVHDAGRTAKGARELLDRVEQDQADGGVLVQVRDSGPGIDPGNLEQAFEPFYTTKTSGVGMGLSICRSIINGHGGRLWAEANEYRGAVFQFTLPGAGAQHVSGSKAFEAP